MRKLWRKILATLGQLRTLDWPGRAYPPPASTPPRFICRRAVSWEAGGLRGQGELRELTRTGMRLRTDQVVLAGHSIRVRPLQPGSERPLSLDVVIGTVVYSRSRHGKVDIGIELLQPEKISRFAWFHQLRGQGRRTSPARPLRLLGTEKLHLVGTRLSRPEQY